MMPLSGPFFERTILALGKGLSDDKKILLREIALKMLDIDCSAMNARRALPVLRGLLEHYAPNVPIDYFAAELGGYVAIIHSYSADPMSAINRRLAGTKDPEAEMLVYIKRQFPLDFPDLVKEISTG